VTRLITDQAAANSAAQALTEARANLAAATLKAPVGGTVAAVDLGVGSTAGTGAGIVIARPGSAEVTVDVPLAQLPLVKIGQDATVTPAGATAAVDGAVSAIGMLPASGTAGSSSGTAYPVTVQVPQAPASLATGSRAQVSIVVATASGVLTVPSSAVTRLGPGRAVVTTLRSGVPSRTVVTVGAVGLTSTQVTGLTLGQTVVLADLDTPLPSNANGLRGVRGFGGGGGFGGGSGFGAGAGGGAVGGGGRAAQRG
jgi:multidrug efflux pump subunit AcrA (membrane-fusion protein)